MIPVLVFLAALAAVGVAWGIAGPDRLHHLAELFHTYHDEGEGDE